MIGGSHVASVADRRVVTKTLRIKKIYPANHNVEVAEKDLYVKGSDENHSSQCFGALPLACCNFNGHISLGIT